MPVNYLEVRRQVKEFSAKTVLRQHHLAGLRQEMDARLDFYAERQDFLLDKVNRALHHNASLRCALPTHETLTAHFPVPELPVGIIMLAADGSQITPNRHDQVEFCLINIGVIRFMNGSPNPPTSIVRTRFLDFDELYTREGLITEARIALMRDLNERQVLAEMAEKESGLLVTVTDGPLELYFERKQSEEYERLLGDYQSVLEKLCQVRAATAGYVDKPEGELVGRLLEVADIPDSDLNQAGKRRPYTGVYDEKLFSTLLTGSGERSAVFGIQSLSTQKFKDDLSLHFFYLNVGRTGHPSIARVEIPAWVAYDHILLDALHAMLVSQSNVLGNRPYPYILHRAHEVAVVPISEKDLIEQMIVSELIPLGVDPGQESNKQHAKDISGKG